MPQKSVLIVSDISCVGKCSITVALPILSAAGFAVSVLPTAVLSAHTAFPGAEIVPMTESLESFISSWQELDISFDAILTGYLTSSRQVDIIQNLFNLYPKALRIVDPVMADNGKLYRGFEQDYPMAMLRLCQRADVIIPNITEAALLTQTPFSEAEGNVCELGKRLLDLGAKNAIITGITGENGTIGAAVFQKEGSQRVFSQRREGRYHGTGDIFAAVVTKGLLKGDNLTKAAGDACDFVSRAIADTDPSKDSRYGVTFEPMLT